MSTDAQEQEFVVVINAEEQYSVWFEGRDLPAGWKTVGVSGSKEHCLDYITKTWSDITPLSVRNAMSGAD